MTPQKHHQDDCTYYLLFAHPPLPLPPMHASTATGRCSIWWRVWRWSYPPPLLFHRIPWWFVPTDRWLLSFNQTYITVDLSATFDLILFLFVDLVSLFIVWWLNTGVEFCRRAGLQLQHPAAASPAVPSTSSFWWALARFCFIESRAWMYRRTTRDMEAVVIVRAYGSEGRGLWLIVMKVPHPACGSSSFDTTPTYYFGRSRLMRSLAG